MTLMWLALAGAAGACARFVLDRVVSARYGRHFPWGTLVVNVAGALALGVLVGRGPRLGAEVYLIASVGFLGAFTTFSTWALQSLSLIEAGRWRAAAFNLVGSLVLGVAAAALGWWLAARIAAVT
jgi:CrcB protein